MGLILKDQLDPKCFSLLIYSYTIFVSPIFLDKFIQTKNYHNPAKAPHHRHLKALAILNEFYQIDQNFLKSILLIFHRSYTMRQEVNNLFLLAKMHKDSFNYPIHRNLKK